MHDRRSLVHTKAICRLYSGHHDSMYPTHYMISTELHSIPCTIGDKSRARALGSHKNLFQYLKCVSSSYLDYYGAKCNYYLTITYIVSIKYDKLAQFHFEL